MRFMRVFVTGATGYLGSAVVDELVGAGHRVLGLARSAAARDALARKGAETHRGDLADLESLAAGAGASDGVIHLAFNHDFATYQANCESDRRVIEALGSALVGSARPFVVTAGTGVLVPGRAGTEDDAPLPSSILPRNASEEAAAAVAARGVRVSVVRVPQVHDLDKHGLVSLLIELAREKRVSPFVGDGANRWAAVHRLDAARVVALAREQGAAGAAGATGARYHAVAEEGVPTRDIASVIGRRLSVPVVSQSPEEAASHFGWLAAFAGLDCPISSARTQERLGWKPIGPGLLQDLERAHCFE